MVERVERPPQTDVAQRAGARRREDAENSFERWLSSGRAERGTGDAGTELAGKSASNGGPVVAGDAVAIELHLQSANGRTQIVSMPWTLSATGRMSQASVHSASADEWHWLAGGEAPPASAASFAVGPGTDVALATQAPIEGTTAAVAVHVQATAALRATDGERQAPTPPTMAPMAVPTAAAWAPRLLRWLERQDHDPAVWIRDYSIGDAAARQIADAVRTLAGEQGLRLERIVVNAREVWRAPTPYIPGETG